MRLGAAQNKRRTKPSMAVNAPPSKSPTPMKRSLRCSPSRTCRIPNTIAPRPNTKLPKPHDLKIIARIGPLLAGWLPTAAESPYLVGFS